jgi:hypothetical protein
MIGLLVELENIVMVRPIDIKSISFAPPTTPYKVGHLLSLEGGNALITVIDTLYPAGRHYPKDNAELVFTYPTPADWPAVTAVDFPTSITGNNVPVYGTVHFVDTNRGINLARLDVLGDTCGGCFKKFEFDPGVQNDWIGQFPFNQWCTTDTGFHWAIKLTLSDIERHTSSPYTFSVQCTPVSSAM